MKPTGAAAVAVARHGASGGLCGDGWRRSLAAAGEGSGWRRARGRRSRALGQSVARAVMHDECRPRYVSITTQGGDIFGACAANERSRWRACPFAQARSPQPVRFPSPQPAASPCEAASAGLLSGPAPASMSALGNAAAAAVTQLNSTTTGAVSTSILALQNVTTFISPAGNKDKARACFVDVGRILLCGCE